MTILNLGSPDFVPSHGPDKASSFLREMLWSGSRKVVWFGDSGGGEHQVVSGGCRPGSDHA